MPGWTSLAESRLKPPVCRRSSICAAAAEASANIGQSVAKCGVACLVEGCEPIVEEVAGGDVGNEAHLVAEAGQVNEDGGVNGADVVSPADKHRSVGGIAEDDGVDLGWIVFLSAAGAAPDAALAERQRRSCRR
jgi:hypothetical protein